MLFLSIAKPKTKPVKDITSSTCTDIVAQGVTGSTVGIGSNAYMTKNTFSRQ